MTIGEIIKRYCDRNDVTLEEIAEILDVEERTVQRYVTNERKPGRVTLLNLAKVLDIPVDELTDNSYDVESACDE